MKFLTEKQIEKLHGRTEVWLEMMIDQLKRAMDGDKVARSWRWVPLGDFTDLIRYGGLILSEEYKKARNLHQDLDTNARERIPQYIYNTVEDKT